MIQSWNRLILEIDLESWSFDWIIYSMESKKDSQLKKHESSTAQ